MCYASNGGSLGRVSNVCLAGVQLPECDAEKEAGELLLSGLSKKAMELVEVVGSFPLSHTYR